MSEMIRVEKLKKLFPLRGGLFNRNVGFVHAVDGVTFLVNEGEIFGLVGESGCGKTTCGKLLVRLLAPTKGVAYFKGKDIGEFKGRELKDFRRSSQIIFQDPYESLNPRFTVWETVAEPLIIQNVGSVHPARLPEQSQEAGQSSGVNPVRKLGRARRGEQSSGVKKREELISKALKVVDLPTTSDFLSRFPHELSGGQRQRVSIARAMVIEPKFIVADEPVSMLDVSIRAGIMNLLLRLRDEFNLTCIFITHDLSVARYMCDRIAVMYLGKILEMGEAEEIISNPLHPYTQALLSAVPIPDAEGIRERPKIKGGVQTPINPPPGCRFAPRCLYVKDECKVEPLLKEVSDNHWVSCWRNGVIF